MEMLIKYRYLRKYLITIMKCVSTTGLLRVDELFVAA